MVNRMSTLAPSIRPRGPSFVLACALAVFAACTPLPDTIEACKDADCQREVALRAWQKSPAGLAAEISQMQDPIGQLIAVEAIVEKHPGELTDFCPALPEGRLRERCNTIHMRPHLRSDAEGSKTEDRGSIATTKVSKSQRDSPSFMELVPTKEGNLPSPWKDTAPIDVACEDAALAVPCRTAAAERAAAALDAATAAGACAGIKEEAWRKECFFRASESALADTQRGPDVALPLCLGANDYVQFCLAHLSMALSQREAPMATDMAPAWLGLKAAALQVDAQVRPLDPGLADRVADRIWSESLSLSYRSVDVVTGDPLDGVPPAALPHVRAAAAARLWDLEGSEPRDLATWQARFSEVLAARQGYPGVPAQLGRMGPTLGLWDTWLPGERELPTVMYLGAGRRALSPDPDIDALICLLEAGARGQSPPFNLFGEAIQHPDPLVRWTAARLGQARDARGGFTELLRKSDDPLVRAQADRERHRQGG